MSDGPEPNPSAVAARWEEIAAGIDKMAQRIADSDDFPISPGSSLAGDDKASRPYQVSHAARMCLVAGVDHLHAAKALFLDLHVLHVAAQFSLVRGSLENLSAAFWILHPKARNLRIERTLRWHARNFNDQYIALGPIGLSDEAQRDAKLAKLDSVAVQRGISTQKVREGYRSSRAVRYAEEELDQVGDVAAALAVLLRLRAWPTVGVSGRVRARVLRGERPRRAQRQVDDRPQPSAVPDACCVPIDE
jgi:hypothetical protein